MIEPQRPEVLTATAVGMTDADEATPPMPPGGELTRRGCLRGLAALPLAGFSLTTPPGAVVRPQAYGARPDGNSDSTRAIQEAIDAAGPFAGEVRIEGGTFCIADTLAVRWPRVALVGDGTIKAAPDFDRTPRKAMLEVTGAGVRIEGLTLDQDHRMVQGESIRGTSAVGLRIRNLVSRNTQRAFIALGDRCTDVEIAGCDHFGRGWGVLVPDSRGVARIVVRESRFRHPGDGSVGDAVQFNCPSHGAGQVWLIDLSARGYVGEAKNAGMGFGFARVRDTTLLRCRAEDCEGDGFHWENGSHDALVLQCAARRIGRPDPVGGNGSGFIAYDSDRWVAQDLEARQCWYHGIALSGQASQSQRKGGRVLDCAALGAGRDGLHLTAQRDFEISRCLVRDPSRSAPWRYAGIRIGRQGRTILENAHGRGSGNRVEITGATRPLDAVVIRAQSVGVQIGATICFGTGVSSPLPA
jgi:hypothetical protein